MANWKSYCNNRIFKSFLPFMIIVIGGSVALTQFTDLRIKWRTVQSFSVREEAEKRGIPMKPAGTVTFESEAEKMLKELDFDNWENKRIPRPWEKEETTK